MQHRWLLYALGPDTGWVYLLAVASILLSSSCWRIEFCHRFMHIRALPVNRPKLMPALRSGHDGHVL